MLLRVCTVTVRCLQLRSCNILTRVIVVKTQPELGGNAQRPAPPCQPTRGVMVLQLQSSPMIVGLHLVYFTDDSTIIGASWCTTP